MMFWTTLKQSVVAELEVNMGTCILERALLVEMNIVRCWLYKKLKWRNKLRNITLKKALINFNVFNLDAWSMYCDILAFNAYLIFNRQCLGYTRRKMFSLRRHNKFFLTYLSICTSNRTNWYSQTGGQFSLYEIIQHICNGTYREGYLKHNTI